MNPHSLKELHELFGREDSPNESIWPFIRSDKDSDVHQYIEVYEKLLLPYRNHSINLLEIGVLRGSSLALWSMYFTPDSKIVGIDSGMELAAGNVQRNIWSADNIFITRKDESTSMIRDALSKFPNVDFICPIDAYEFSTIEYLKTIYPGGFDIIIDDCMHDQHFQLQTVRDYGLELLNPGGVFVVEDVNNPGLLSDQIRNSVQYPCQVEMVGGGRHEYNGLVIIQKM